MGIFGKWVKPESVGDAEEAPPKTAQKNDQSSIDPELEKLADNALDTLAELIRTVGTSSFDIGEGNHELFVKDCEKWASHVLTGSREKEPDTDPGKRAWGDIRRFLRSRRQKEVAFVEDQLGEFKDVVWEMVDSLGTMASTGRTTEVVIQDSLTMLESAIQSDSIATVRSILGPTMKTISEAIQKQQERFTEQLRSMSDRMEAMKGDLLATQRQAELDALTKVFNRGAFDNRLQKSIQYANLSDRLLCLMFIDLDHFKQVNDKYGHLAGDQVLVETAKNIVRAFPRKDDFVARYGGEEFAVIVFDVMPKDATRLTFNLLRRMRKTDIEYEKRFIYVTCSIGYTYLEPSDTAETFIKRADEALYRAKERGRDRAEVA